MFKYNGDDEYKATIDLPNDGTPDSARYLELQVYIEEDDTISLHLGIRYPVLGKFKYIVKGAEITVEQASELLYPAARIRTIKVLEPTGK